MGLTSTLLAEYKKNACYRLDENLRMIELALEKVDESEVWEKPNSVLNSLGNLILHLCGNLTQYIHAGLGGEKDHRHRDKEFEEKESYGKKVLMENLKSVVAKAKKYIQLATLEDCLQVRKIQGFELSGLGSILHAVEHFSYHTGQIAFWVKYSKAEDLNFYGDRDLNALNQ